MKIEFAPIGVIRTPHTSLAGMPIQPAGAAGIQGRVEVLPEYAEGLRDLDGFSHIVLLYHFHRSAGFRLTVVPFLDTVPRGLFATRAPHRPNGIGLSVVRLLRVEGAVLEIENVDILDNTPLLDIKPYVPEFDVQTGVRCGWLEKAAAAVVRHRADDRFREP
ncbi:MAG: tRNA (N6-threonylcarbamoyladenosine(37)-N6)-methyltransferase TrmO [Thermodesulfobacteriota bacterium]